MKMKKHITTLLSLLLLSGLFLTNHITVTASPSKESITTQSLEKSNNQSNASADTEKTTVITRFYCDNVEIAESVTLTGKKGEHYQTAPKEIPGYYLIDKKNKNGTFEYLSTEIIYSYSKKPVTGKETGTVITIFSSNGKEIAERITQTGLIGEPYSTDPSDGNILGDINYLIPEYYNSKANGFFSAKTEVVEFHYYPLPSQSSITTKFLSGNVEIASPVIQKLERDKKYQTTAKVIPGYTLSTQMPHNASGIVPNKDIEVVYNYTKNPTTGTVITHFLEGDTKLADSIKITGNIGEKYQTSPKNITGYSLRKTAVVGSQGSFAEGTIDVTYNYIKNVQIAQGTVTTYYQADGIEIAAPTTQSGKSGTAYQTSPKDITGYILTNDHPKNGRGQYTDKSQKVIYHYTKMPEQQQKITPSNKDRQSTETIVAKNTLPKTGEMSAVFPVTLGVIILTALALFLLLVKLTKPHTFK